MQVLLQFSKYCNHVIVLSNMQQSNSTNMKVLLSLSARSYELPASTRAGQSACQQNGKKRIAALNNYFPFWMPALLCASLCIVSVVDGKCWCVPNKHLHSVLSVFSFSTGPTHCWRRWLQQWSSQLSTVPCGAASWPALLCVSLVCPLFCCTSTASSLWRTSSMSWAVTSSWWYRTNNHYENPLSVIIFTKQHQCNVVLSSVFSFVYCT